MKKKTKVNVLNGLSSHSYIKPQLIGLGFPIKRFSFHHTARKQLRKWNYRALNYLCLEKFSLGTGNT